MTSRSLFLTVILVPVILFGLLYAWPKYGIWQREQSGRAQLAEAEWSKKIAVEEARAKFESAKLESDAEIERARGAAEAQRIIAETLTPEYLRYLWIQQVESGSNRQVIYVPTEAGLPLLESTRLLSPQTQQLPESQQ